MFNSFKPLLKELKKFESVKLVKFILKIYNIDMKNV